MTQDELNDRTHELARERFEFEKLQKQQESRFLYKNFAAVISAAISIAALALSISQVWSAYIQKQGETALENSRHVNQLRQEKERDDRKWNYDSLQFVAANKDVIFGGDNLQQERIRDVMLVTFPNPVLDKLFPEILDRAKPEQKAIWLNGQKTIDARNIDSANTQQADLPPNILNKDVLVSQLTSSERLSVSNSLIQLYQSNKPGVVTALINAILPDSDNNSYRNNLYIAVTLGKIPGGWEGSDEQLQAMAQLKHSNNYQDSTFKRWVDKAVSNRIGRH